MLGTKRVCRVRIAKDELEKMSKEDFHKSWLLQEQYVDYIEAKLSENTDHSELANLRESEEKLKQQQLEATRRENILVMRLTTKEQEVQEYAGQIQELKQAQVPTLTQLRSTLVDPAVNVMFDRMRKEIETLKARLEETQNELSAWKFTPDSNTGKRLMAKCRLLYQENEELGKMISSGRMAKLEGDLALQRTFSDEMKKSQSELDEFLLELDEDVEGMQSTIYYLQQQLRESKEHISKLQKENEKLAAVVANPSAAERNFLNNGNVDSSENKAIMSPNGHLPSNNVSVNDINPKPRSPTCSDLNRTEGLSNQKPDKGTNSTQPWSPPPEPAEGAKKVDQSEPMNLTVEVDSQRQDQTDTVAASRQQQSPQSSVNHQNQKPMENSVAAQPTVASARGSLHVEAYDSEQEAEPVVPSAPAATAREQHADVSAASVTTSDLTVKDRSPSVSPKKAAEQASKRTPESSGRVSRKRTRNTRSSSHAYVEEDSSACELPTVKRLRRRDIVVEQDITESDSKRTQLQMDAINDAEVQVAQTLATWAAAKQERKDSQVSSSNQDHISEAVGNGELRGGRVNENAT